MTDRHIQESERLAADIEAAHDAFFAELSRRHPEASGDGDFEMQGDFWEAATNAVKAWRYYNVKPSPVELLADRLTAAGMIVHTEPETPDVLFVSMIEDSTTIRVTIEA